MNKILSISGGEVVKGNIGKVEGIVEWLGYNVWLYYSVRLFFFVDGLLVVFE